VKSRSALGFALGALTAASIGAATTLPLFAGNDRAAAEWAAAGFLAMAVPSILCGICLEREHGRPGPRFLLVLVAGFGARVVLAALTSIFAAKASAATALIAGLAAGFVPLTAFEMAWFARKRALRLEAEPRR
jgi:hypothetical protein